MSYVVPATEAMTREAVVPFGGRLREAAVSFGDGRALVGVVTEPAGPAPGAAPPAAIFLNSGLVHRIGPNRLYVRLARAVAARGMVALRFDRSGIGDSQPARDGRAIAERWAHETRAAMDHLGERHGITRFLLLGNCSGAAAAYVTALSDARVVGLGLVNPQAPAIPLRYYARLALTQPNFWRRLVRGSNRAGRSAAAVAEGGAARSERSAASILAGLASLADRGVDMLVVHSFWDAGYDYYHRALRRRFKAAGLDDRTELHVVPGANHEFSMVAGQERLLRIVDHWVARRLEDRWA